MASIRDVAKKAGVTVGTVSRAFNGYKDIKAETKDRILEVAKEIGYTPNLSAKSLASKNKVNIAMLISGFLENKQTDELIYLFMKGAYRFARKFDFEIATYAIDSELQKQKSYDQFCTEHSLAGALILGLRMDDSYYKSLKKTTIPCVTVDSAISGELVGNVLINDTSAFSDLTDYLVRNHHRKIVVLYGRKQSIVSIKRFAGAQRVFERYEIELPKHRVLYTDFDQDTAYLVTRKYLQRYGKTDATAFLCMSDMTAIGAMQAIREQGYSIPEDFSLVGYDGLSVTQYTTPGITTIDQNAIGKGYAAAELLSKIMAGDDQCRQLVLPHKMVLRDSVREI